MFSELLDKFKKTSTAFKSVVIFLVVLTLWMMTFIFKNDKKADSFYEKKQKCKL